MVCRCPRPLRVRSGTLRRPVRIRNGFWHLQAIAHYSSVNGNNIFRIIWWHSSFRNQSKIRSCSPLNSNQYILSACQLSKYFAISEAGDCSFFLIRHLWAGLVPRFANPGKLFRHSFGHHFGTLGHYGSGRNATSGPTSTTKKDRNNQQTSFDFSRFWVDSGS